MPTFQAITSSGNVASGAIVGATPNPYACAFASGGGYYQTDELADGDPGDFSLLTSPDLSIEFWFSIEKAPAAVRAVWTGPQIDVGGNRQWGFEINTDLTVRFYVRDSTSTLALLTSSVPITANTAGAGQGFNNWHYIVGTLSTGTGLMKLWIDDVGVAQTTYTGTNLHAMIAAGNPQRCMILASSASSSEQMAFDELAVYNRYLSGRIDQHYLAGTQRGFPTQKPGARMIGVLDRSTSVHAPRSLQPGTRTVTESYMAAQPPLAELQKARAADNVDAMLFISKSGVVTFLAADYRSTTPMTTVTFGDAGGNELAYVDLELDYSNSFLTNEWNVTREPGYKPPPYAGNQGETQTALDTSSISSYFRRPNSLSDVPVTTDTDAATIASALLAKTKNPMLRVTSISLNTIDPNVADAALALELGNRIRVLRTAPGGGARIDQTLYLQKIEVSGANDGAPWSIRLGVSPL